MVHLALEMQSDIVGDRIDRTLIMKLCKVMRRNSEMGRRQPTMMTCLFSYHSGQSDASAGKRSRLIEVGTH
jgi:hypothetical protein